MDAEIGTADLRHACEEFLRQRRLQRQSHEDGRRDGQPAMLLVNEKLVRIILVEVECQQFSGLPLDKAILPLIPADLVTRHASFQAWRKGRSAIKLVIEPLRTQDEVLLPGNEVVVEIVAEAIGAVVGVNDHGTVRQLGVTAAPLDLRNHVVQTATRPAQQLAPLDGVHWPCFHR